MAGSAPATGQAAQAGKSFIWTSLESVSVSGLLFLVVIVMARILTPEQFGVVAIALAVITPMTAIVESLFYEATIHVRELTDRHLDTAFTVAMALGCVGFALCWALGLVLAPLFGAPELRLLTGVLGSTLLFSGLAAIPVAVLRRELQYKSLAMRSLAGRGLGSLIGLGAAAAGWGEWALVVQQLATAMLGFAVILGTTQRFPRLGFGRAEFRELALYGVPSVLTTLTFHLDVRGFSLLVGYLYGTVVLGYLNLAFRLVEGIRDMLHASTYHLALPLLSRRRDDREGVYRGYLRLLRMVAAVSLPLFVLGGVFAPELVVLTVGRQWMPSIGSIQAVAAAACIYFMIDSAPIVFGTLRRPQWGTAINVAGLVCGLLLVGLLPRVAGTVQPALVWLLRWGVIAGLTYGALLRLGLPGGRLLRASAPPVVVALVLACVLAPVRGVLAAVLPPFGVVALGGVVAVLLAVGLEAVLMRATLLDVGRFLHGAFLGRLRRRRVAVVVEGGAAE